MEKLEVWNLSFEEYLLNLPLPILQLWALYFIMKSLKSKFPYYYVTDTLTDHQNSKELVNIGLGLADLLTWIFFLQIVLSADRV